MQIDVKKIANCSCETTQGFTHESSPHHNTGFNLHEIESGQETNKQQPQVTIDIWTSTHWQRVRWETFAHGRDVWLFSFWGLSSATQLLVTGGHLEDNPHAPKLGHYLFTDSRRLIWKRCRKMISAWPALVSTVFRMIVGRVWWAVPALLKDRRWFEGLLRCIPPQARRAVSGKPAGCYSGGKKKKPIPSS